MDDVTMVDALLWARYVRFRGADAIGVGNHSMQQP